MARALPQPVRVYRVGGSVRDELLGRAVVDHDYVLAAAGLLAEVHPEAAYRLVQCLKPL